MLKMEVMAGATLWEHESFYGREGRKEWGEIQESSAFGRRCVHGGAKVHGTMDQKGTQA